MRDCSNGIVSPSDMYFATSSSRVARQGGQRLQAGEAKRKAVPAVSSPRFDVDCLRTCSRAVSRLNESQCKWPVLTSIGRGLRELPCTELRQKITTKIEQRKQHRSRAATASLRGRQTDGGDEGREREHFERALSIDQLSLPPAHSPSARVNGRRSSLNSHQPLGRMEEREEGWREGRRE